MHVKKLKSNSNSSKYSLFEVNDGDRWWTASHDKLKQTWFIMNESLTEISESSKLGKSIIKAVETWKNARNRKCSEVQ